jgi:hypothetical protein
MTSIHRAITSDISEVMEFIGREWAAEHVLSKSEELFLWQYSRQQNGELNFLLARNGKKLVGMLGLTFNSQYCKTGVTNDIKWLSMWKVTPEAQKGTGLRLLNFAESTFPTFGTGTVGCNIKALQIYKSLGYLTGELNHFYYPNHNHIFDNSSIYNFGAQELLQSQKQNLQLFIENVEENSMFKKLDLYLNKNPQVEKFKSSEYIINRYLNHPFYKYQLKLIIDSNQKELGFIVFRVSQTFKGNVLRVLELVLNEKGTDVGSALEKLLVQNNCQYADFYTKTVHGDNLYENGFVPVENSMNLPNLFEPLSFQKSRIYFALNLNQEIPMQITRGDCDQDRPNILT